MASTKPKPAELRELEGNPSKRPIPQTVKPASDDITCPKHLSYHAKLEWRRIVPQLKKLGLLTNIDRSALAAYCQAYGRWVDAENKIRESGYLHRTKSGNVLTSPYLWVANKAMEQMYKFLAEFGMTPSSRTKLATGPVKDKDPFEELLNFSRESTKGQIHG